MLDVKNVFAGPDWLSEKEIRIFGFGRGHSTLLHRNPEVLQGHATGGPGQEVQLWVLGERGWAAKVPPEVRHWESKAQDFEEVDSATFQEICWHDRAGVYVQILRDPQIHLQIWPRAIQMRPRSEFFKTFFEQFAMIDIWNGKKWQRRKKELFGLEN